MRVLAINCGSSSLKTAVIDAAARGHLADARIEGIGSDGAESDHDAALATALERLDSQTAPLAKLDGIGHRITHGGARFVAPVLIDADVERGIEALDELAPLHNPVALAGVRAARRLLPGLPQIAVFDTAFHATLPRSAREYALPSDITQKLQIRRYGFHGISHSHVAQAAAQHLGTDAGNLRIVSCHLGSGSSVAAIEHGRSVETSMGMTPLEGLVMGTRAGDVDPGVILLLLKHAEHDATKLDQLLNQQSGLAGLTGTADVRQIERRAGQGDEACQAALGLLSHRVRKYIGAYVAVMGGVDVIAFTGGIGEGSSLIRRLILQRFEYLGALLDEERNRAAVVDLQRPLAELGAAGSRVRLLAVRADEELAIGCQAAALLALRSP